MTRGPDTKPHRNVTKNSDKINPTNEETRCIKPALSKGFEQSYNAQDGVDTQTMQVLTAHNTKTSNEKREVAHTIEGIEAQPEELGRVQTIITDIGYSSTANA